MEWNFELEEEWLALTEDDPELLESHQLKRLAELEGPRNDFVRKALQAKTQTA
jgi:hypothetical protein